jgi:phage recombination protein Bet
MTTNNTAITKPKKSELTTRLENRGIDPMLWNAIGASIFPGASDESKLMAIDYCKSRNLDIMKKPCHIVPMNVKDAKTGQYSWRDIIMPGIAEIRITADRTGKYAGQDAPIFGPMVEMDFGKSTYTVPEFCTVTVYRIINGERVSFSHTEFFEEAANTTKDGALNSMWSKRKRGQLSKCAEAGALRKAFPEESGGIIAAEEATDDHMKVATGRVVNDNPMKLANPYQDEPAEPYDGLKGAVPAELPPLDPQPTDEPPMESPVEVSEQAEREQLLGDIRDTLAEANIKTAKFAPLCRDAGLLPSGTQIIDAPIEMLRVIHGNRLAIAEGTYKAEVAS